MLRVGVVGAGGRMGREVCRAVGSAGDLQLVAAVDPSCAGEPLAPELSGVPGGLKVSSGLPALAEGGAEVVVDFTVAEAARDALGWYAAHGMHAVVGTTGLGGADLDRAAAAFLDAGVNLVVAPNFAIGAVLLMRFCELAAPFMDGAEIIELHHDGKRDAPSGTALQTAERIARARSAGAAPYAGDATTLEVVPGARGGAGPGEVRLHSVRLPGLVAHQEVVFGAAGQSLTLRHDSYDRASFMPGVLLAVRAVGGRPGLTLGLDPLLGL